MFSLLPKDIVNIIACEVHRYTTIRVVAEYNATCGISVSGLLYVKGFYFNFRNLSGRFQSKIVNMRCWLGTCCCVNRCEVDIPKRYFFTSGDNNNIKP